MKNQTDTSGSRVIHEHGIGELLRHLVELTDGSADSWYETLNCNYRARYTPVMRVLKEGPLAVKDLQQRLAVTQGAVSQTIKLMLDEQLIAKQSGEDARQTIVGLSKKGEKTLKLLQPHWDAIFETIRGLEHEIGLPLMASLRQSVEALEQTSFAQRVETSKTARRKRSPTPAESGYFQRDGSRYAEYRPKYPSSLAGSLAKLCRSHNLAVDAGCGTGQLTHLVADHFEKILGIDVSQTQLDHAVKLDNTSYALQRAESIDLPDSSVDLILAAQAAHWFNLDGFYSEVIRLGNASSVVALICYGVPYIAHPLNTTFQRGYWQDVHEYWPQSRRHVEFGYADLYFPFEPIGMDFHQCRQEMTVDGLINYIKTWSAYERALSNGQETAFLQYFELLRASCEATDVFEVIWPITVKAGHIHKQG